MNDYNTYVQQGKPKRAQLTKYGYDIIDDFTLQVVQI